MSLEGLSGLVNRIIAWADRLQREHGVLGFPYAVVKKYGDDAGGRQAALITYYGFLSVFPLLLLGVAVLSRVLADHPDLRQRLIAAIVPQALRSTVEHSLATLPTSTIPFAVGLIGLLFSGTGVVFSAYQTLNHVAAVRYRFRAGFLSRYVRVFAVLVTLMAGALATGALTVVATALPGQPAVQRAAAVLGSALVVFAVLLLGAKWLLARPAPVRALWPGAIIGAAAVTVVLNAGAPLLARLVAKAGPVYGSFATVAGWVVGLRCGQHDGGGDGWLAASGRPDSGPIQLGQVVEGGPALPTIPSARSTGSAAASRWRCSRASRAVVRSAWNAAGSTTRVSRTCSAEGTVPLP